MITGADSRKKWSLWDRLIMEAYQIVENEKCDRCGLPRWICHNESNEIQYHIVRDECSTTATIERQSEDDEKNKYKAHGEQLSAEPYSVEGKPLIEYRDTYYEQLAAEAAKLAAINEV